MKLPRNISSAALISSFQKLGYEVSGQKGSHIRLTTLSNSEHHLTIPAHNPLKLGTLSAVLNEVAGHFKSSKGEVIEKLFG